MEQNQVAVAVAAAFDISRYELADTGVLTFKDKKGKDDLIGADGVNPAQVRLYSTGSAEGMKALYEFGKATGELMAKKLPESDPEAYQREYTRASAERLAGFTAEFINFPADVKAFYLNPRLQHLHRQVEAFIGSYGNF